MLENVLRSSIHDLKKPFNVLETFLQNFRISSLKEFLLGPLKGLLYGNIILQL